jgi:ABC-type branched-subunit amino acid transport system substrate-binding protein
VVTCVYYDENLLNYHPAHEMEGLVSCLDYFQAVDDPFSKALQDGYAKKFPGTKYLFTAGSASTGMYRGMKFYEAAVKATGGKLGREEVAAAMDTAVLPEGPGGGAQMVPGKFHARMNMYTAVCRNDAGKTRYEVIDKADMVDPREC